MGLDSLVRLSIEPSLGYLRTLSSWCGRDAENRYSSKYEGGELHVGGVGLAKIGFFDV